jgi:hypothetical protein
VNVVTKDDGVLMDKRIFFSVFHARRQLGLAAARAALRKGVLFCGRRMVQMNH